MSGNRTSLHRWFGFIPTGGPGLIGFGVVVVLVFALGMILAGGNGTGSETGSAHHDHGTMESSEPATWTCSMHPQIQLPEPGKCPICFMDLIPLEDSGSGDLGRRELKMSDGARKLARIQTTPVRRASAEAHVRMVGRITYDETRMYTISAWVPGRIDSLYADYVGERVTKGDPIACIYSPELLSTQEELIQARRAISNIGDGGTVLKRTAEETIKAVRKKLSLYGLSDEQIEAIESTGMANDHLNIHAPASGIVIAKNAQEGGYVSTGTAIYQVADLARLWVEFESYETDLPWLHVGQTVHFTTPSLPGQEFEGEITFIDPLVDRRSRTVEVRAEVNNGDGRLKPDMFVSAVVTAGPRVQGTDARFASAEEMGTSPLVIPASAPLITGTRAVVYVEHSRYDEIVYEGREVVLGPRVGDYYVVISGLEEGEQVVTNGAFKIDSELQIQARPSMMSPEGGKPEAGHQHAEHDELSDGDTDHELTTASGTHAYQIDNATRAALTPLYTSYLRIQMDLANDNLDAAHEHYDTFLDASDNVDTSLFSGEAHMAWMDMVGRLIRAAEQGTGADDIDDARRVFNDLSNAMIDLQREFGYSGDKTLYLTYCPMAFDNKGAYWIQAVDTIYNSYFGSRMLRCGEIKQEIAPFSEGDS